MNLWRRFTSRKFLMALAAFVAVNVAPNLPAEVQAQLSAGIAAIYGVAEAYVDAHRPS